MWIHTINGNISAGCSRDNAYTLLLIDCDDKPVYMALSLCLAISALHDDIIVHPSSPASKQTLSLSRRRRMQDTSK